jgi:hypothetical protein
MSDYYYLMHDLYEEDDEVTSLMRDKFWARIRSTLYKKICKGQGGANQWAYITGRKRTDRYGDKILLTDRNKKFLQNIVDYLDSTEGRDDLIEIGITEPPDHIDLLIDYVQSAKTMQEIKLEEFRMYLKNRDKIWQYLAR